MLLFIQGILTECLLYTRRPARSWELPAGTGQSSSPRGTEKGTGSLKKKAHRHNRKQPHPATGGTKTKGSFQDPFAS